MAIENVKLFYEEVNSNEGLQEKVKGLQEISEEEEKIKQLISMAGEEGFEFSEDEFKSYIQEVIADAQESGELSDEALEQVSGGTLSYWILNSICTLGLTCVMSAVGRKKGKCALDAKPNELR